MKLRKTETIVCGYCKRKFRRKVSRRPKFHMRCRQMELPFHG